MKVNASAIYRHLLIYCDRNIHVAIQIQYFIEVLSANFSNVILYCYFQKLSMLWD